jgi:hypothetical protein
VDLKKNGVTIGKQVELKLKATSNLLQDLMAPEPASSRQAAPVQRPQTAKLAAPKF